MANAGRVQWDAVGYRYYEAGVKNVVLYVWDSANNKYGAGVAWNGITAVNESPSGAESNQLWANNAKYANLISAEDFAATIEAYTYPDEFMACDGFAALEDGVYVSQQTRKSFCFTYRTEIGNDTDELNAGYKIHLVYGALAAPSSRDRSTLNDSPEALTMSWEISTTPVPVEGYKPTAHVIIDSTVINDAAKMANLENYLYGTAAVAAVEEDLTHDIAAVAGVDATIPTIAMPDEIADILAGTKTGPTEDEAEAEVETQTPAQTQNP